MYLCRRSSAAYRISCIYAVSVEVFATSAGTASTRDLDILEWEFVVVRQLLPLNDAAKSEYQYVFLTYDVHHSRVAVWL